MQIHGVVRSILATKHEASGGCHERSEEGASRERSGAIPPLAELMKADTEKTARDIRKLKKPPPFPRRSSIRKSIMLTYLSRFFVLKYIRNAEIMEPMVKIVIR